MYLHVGSNENIRISDIIGIFDADTATVSQITKKYLSNRQSLGKVVFAAEEIPKSFLLVKDRKKGFQIVFSPLSSSSLIGRVGQMGYGFH